MDVSKINFGGGIWEVRIHEGILSIVDDQGRERHRSNGHMKTGEYLAMLIEDREFESTPILDRSLRMGAERFVENIEPK